MASSIHHLLSSSCKHVGPPLASCSVLLKSHRTSSPLLCSSCKLHHPLESTSHFLLQVPSCSWKHIGLPVRSKFHRPPASTSDFLFQVPSSSCWQQPSRWFQIPWTWIPLAACPSKNYTCSTAYFHLKRQGLGLTPIRTSWAACLSKNCSCRHLKRQMTNLLRGFKQLCMGTQSLQGRLLHKVRKHAGFGWKEHATGVRGAALYTVATPWRSDSRMSWVSG